MSGRQPYRLFVTLTCSCVALIALAVIAVGWGLDVSAVRSVIPGAVAMKFQSALGLTCAAAALAALRPSASAPRVKLGLVLALIPGVIGVAVLVEYLLHVRLGIDELPFTDHAGRAKHVPYPGRMAPTTAACFVLLTAALLTLDRGLRWRWRPAELVSIPMGIVASMSLIGYTYSISAFYGPASAAKMAVNTAACLLALAVAILLARPRGRFLELATTTDPGGVMVRRMVPLCLLVPLALGWLYLQGLEWGAFGDRVGMWWLAAATIVVLIGMMWWCAGTLSGADQARRALERQLAQLANHDSLTGLFSRHRFEQELDQLLARARRYGDTGSLLLLDLDRMKATNDTLGHAAGDQLLRSVADTARGLIRESDMAARLGGDEFAVILLGADPTAAVKVADDLREAIAQIRVETPMGTGWSKTSIGIAPIDCSPEVSSAELIRRADEAMYRAKQAGGDRVAVTTYVSEQPTTPGQARQDRAVSNGSPATLRA